MSPLKAVLLSTAIAGLLALASGCASSGGSSRRSTDDYYGRGTVHADSYPATYGRGGGYRYGRYGRPGRYNY